MASARDKATSNGPESEEESKARSEFEAALGHTFENSVLLDTALTHRSYANEHSAEGAKDNETLEFLGDAVLDLVIGEHLMTAFPKLGEGDLSMTRAQMVSEQGLELVARQLGVGQQLRLGKGEERTGGRGKASLLADALEAIVAAIYLDPGFDVAKRVVLAHFAKRTPKTPGQSTDFKTRLQELVQRVYKSPPTYELVASTGPDHEKVFEVAVLVRGEESARGTGHSKKAAEQAAAAAALEVLAAESA